MSESNTDVMQFGRTIDQSRSARQMFYLLIELIYLLHCIQYCIEINNSIQTILYEISSGFLITIWANFIVSFPDGVNFLHN